jgi:hypothetical protein
MTQPRNHTIAVSGLAAGLGPLVGNGIYSGADSDDGEAILKEFQDGLPGAGYISFPLELLGFAALAVFVACLVVRLYAVAPVAAVTTGVAGATMLAVKVGSAAPWMYVIANADDLDPATAEVLMGLNDMAFVVSGFLLSVAFTAAGIGLLKTDTSRVLAWWPTAMGALGVVAGIVGTVNPDAYLPVPFLLLLVWMIAVGIAAAMRSGPNGSNTSLVGAAGTE